MKMNKTKVAINLENSGNLKIVKNLWKFEFLYDSLENSGKM